MFEAYRQFYGQKPDRLGATQFLTARIRHKDSTIFVAMYNGVLVGFAQMYPLFSSTRLGRLFLLNDVYVSPDFRGKTVGRQLIDHCKAHARETDAVGILLEADKVNTQGNKLYQRAGLELDTDHNYYFWKK
ncbi:MAG: GNAT family N-acetyltransferase [Saprospirales bacterium]|nr:GNAT family N-acetyltransferase [Saprospirales bacterium]MBK8492424.1 GNAT family N-acetyltransferase [Saprospirales bacterium]